jgi:hypothetical protein
MVLGVDSVIIRVSSRAQEVPELVSSYYRSLRCRLGTHMTTHRGTSLVFLDGNCPLAVLHGFFRIINVPRKTGSTRRKYRMVVMNRGVVDHVSQLLGVPRR